jgi:hypothetical protein
VSFVAKKNQIDETRFPGYNMIMKEQKCNTTNNIAKYIRIVLSLTIIALGIIYQNWVGILGLLTLYTAVTGTCGTSLRIPRRKDYRLKE